MKIGIIGHAADKFTDTSKAHAISIIEDLLALDGNELVSGGCHLGGVDIWAEEVADRLGRPKHIYLPEKRSWHGGYRERNLRIAYNSDVVHVIVVKSYPKGYLGRKHERGIMPWCYHCHNNTHVKSGACWTARKAKRKAWHII